MFRCRFLAMIVGIRPISPGPRLPCRKIEALRNVKMTAKSRMPGAGAGACSSREQARLVCPWKRRLTVLHGKGLKFASLNEKLFGRYWQ